MNRKELIKLIKNKPFFMLPLFREAYPSKFLIYGSKPYNLRPRYGYGRQSRQKLFEIINKNRNVYKYKNYLSRISNKNNNLDSLNLRWDEWIVGLDAIALYAFLCLNNPKRYYEIGSGNSTKFARLAIKDFNLKTKITSIDPQPRVEIDLICNKVIRKPVEDIDISLCKELEANDILFIDGSHRCFMNSDVTVVFLDILPIFKKGVFVEFHDVYLPYDYCPQLAGNFFSEQYLLTTHLLAEGNSFAEPTPPKYMEVPRLSSHGDSTFLLEGTS